MDGKRNMAPEEQEDNGEDGNNIDLQLNVATFDGEVDDNEEVREDATFANFSHV